MYELPNQSKNLGLRRSEMPQIESKRVPDFLKWLKKEHGISSSLAKRIYVKTLSPTQAEKNDSKIKGLINASDSVLKKPVILSRELYLADGHHRVYAAYAKDENYQIPAYLVVCDIQTLMQLMHKYQHSFRKDVNEMIKFKNISYPILNEELVTIGGKAYPKFNNAVLMAGGAGSGKGFVINNLLGIEGMVLDVDRLKTLILASTKIKAMIKKETGKDLDKFNLRNPDDVGKLHMLIKQWEISNGKSMDTIKEFHAFKSLSLAPPDRKPNVIIDGTMKELSKLYSFADQISYSGYERKNIHLIWVVNDIEMARDQNRNRDRVVADDILFKTHQGAAYTFKDFLKLGDRGRSVLDGDIWVVFNKRGADSDMVIRPEGERKQSGPLPPPDVKDKNGKIKTNFKRQGAGQYILKSNKFLIKKAGKPAMKLADIDRLLSDKLIEYTPLQSRLAESASK